MSMTASVRNPDGVTFHDSDSPDLFEVATRIKQLRDTARSSGREHARALNEINSDTSLSDQGRHERITELDSHRRAQRKTWIAQEKDIITNKMTELERRLDGYVGYAESNIIAFRDAQDRAESVKDEERAASLMARALRNGDRTLAHALYRHAVENHWREPAALFAKENPAVASLVNDVQKLRNLLNDTFSRGVAYM